MRKNPFEPCSIIRNRVSSAWLSYNSARAIIGRPKRLNAFASNGPQSTNSHTCDYTWNRDYTSDNGERESLGNCRGKQTNSDHLLLLCFPLIAIGQQERVVKRSKRGGFLWSGKKIVSSIWGKQDRKLARSSIARDKLERILSC